ncbi:MAG: 50S ribosomal protein L9 [Candidatus Omnitrophica bacterium]|jgi:large subunit ribosomal protein L9|nr:50S ribosomal protein L9 [Candidatus Omnitrophota bacterium]
MEVILNKDVANIGKAGQVIKAKDGFARNFLIPNGLAVPLNTVNLKKLEEDKQRKTLQQEKLKKEADELSLKISGLSLTIPVLTQEEDKLYGSIGIVELLASLKEEGIELEKNKIALTEPLKALGIYEVPVKLHPEVTAKLKVWIVKK